MRQYMKSRQQFPLDNFCVIKLHIREKLESDKQKILTELEAFRKYCINYAIPL